MLMVDVHRRGHGRLPPQLRRAGAEPEVLPAAFPNLLVNGASGIAVGMATNMAPHNLGEVIAAARHLIDHPDASLDDLMRFVPGPDLPTGGKIVGLEGIRDAYETGRGTFRTRATTTIENVTPDAARASSSPSCPYTVGPERVIAKIKELVNAKKLQGISDLKDLTDRSPGCAWSSRSRTASTPRPSSTSSTASRRWRRRSASTTSPWSTGSPAPSGCATCCRSTSTTASRSSAAASMYRRKKRQDRLHLVDGLLLALLDIDEVIQVIRHSDDAAQAKQRLMQIFDLRRSSRSYILDMPLRRLTRSTGWSWRRRRSSSPRRSPS